MLSLKITARASDATRALRDAAREAGNVAGGGSPTSILNSYRQWANVQSLLVNQYLADDEIPNVISTPRYWALHGSDVTGFSDSALDQYIRQELRERIEYLAREATALDSELARWNPYDRHGGRSYSLTALVLDTNVMLTHHAGLANVPWHTFFPTEFPEVTPLGIAIPIEVVRELDRLKMASNNNLNRGTKDELRKDAGSALRLIEGIDDPSRPQLLRDWDLNNHSVPAISLLLIADRVPGQPLADPDSEIVDRAASLLPFANGVFLVSYDAAIVFRARLAGVTAKKLTYGWDAPDGEPTQTNRAVT
jgi:hypothetical protein